jgi:hypothetical protein
MARRCALKATHTLPRPRHHVCVDCKSCATAPPRCSPRFCCRARADPAKLETAISPGAALQQSRRHGRDQAHALSRHLVPEGRRRGEGPGGPADRSRRSLDAARLVGALRDKRQRRVRRGSEAPAYHLHRIACRRAAGASPTRQVRPTATGIVSAVAPLRSRC